MRKNHTGETAVPNKRLFSSQEVFQSMQTTAVLTVCAWVSPTIPAKPIAHTGLGRLIAHWSRANLIILSGI